MSIGDDLLNERRRRKASDRRITPEGREILLRLVDGDLVGELQASSTGSPRPTRSLAATENAES
jgi:hypothetical protein